MSSTDSEGVVHFNAKMSGQHGPTLLDTIDHADQGLIADPLLFPWQLLEARGTNTPLVVDVSRCADAHITALRPVLARLGAHDTIFSADSSNDAIARSLAGEYGTRSVMPAPADRRTLRRQKSVDQLEQTILTRLAKTLQLHVVEWAEITNTNWANFSWATIGDSRPLALAVRVPGSVIRDSRPDFASLLDGLVSTTSGAEVLDISGLRGAPGEPLERALVTIGCQR